MIRYALKCSEGHQFDSWFQSAAAYDSLAEKGLVACAVCGSSDVSKAMMAPRVAVDSDKAPVPAPEATAPAAPASAPSDTPLSAPSHPMEQMLRSLKEHVEKTSTYVGGRFAEEARALIEDGVPIAPLPIFPKDKAN